VSPSFAYPHHCLLCNAEDYQAALRVTHVRPLTRETDNIGGAHWRSGARRNKILIEIVCWNDPDGYCDGYRSLSARSEGEKEEPMAGHRVRVLALAGALAAASMSAASSATAANFDGYWSLVAQTTNGHCGATRWDVAISDGQLYYPGGLFMGFPIGLDGAVSPSGRLQVTVAAGPRVASGAGRLGRLEGRGKWAGQGPSGTCSGVWTATRVQPHTVFAPSGHAAYASEAASPGIAPQTPMTYWTQPYPPPFWTPHW